VQKVNTFQNPPVPEFINRRELKDDGPPPAAAQKALPLAKGAGSELAMREISYLSSWVPTKYQIACPFRIPGRPDAQVNDIILCHRIHVGPTRKGFGENTKARPDPQIFSSDLA
jgi:hypothetical protein